MIRVATTTNIARPVQDVLDYVADMTNAPKWQEGLHDVRRITDGPIRVGSEHEFVRTSAGRRLSSRNSFLAYEPDTFVQFEIQTG